ncbi:hypothetical protein NLJ89_g1756 [Agrocybe chaxingu]|uniref:DUF1793-domain-containing protein n=1 Tax=Agrocybe chaxingu TaxID=84603 RepID=A0A9W8TEM7_9AGAR|nr:hypothetical protein NLJ89_g1756 [Agrocybe chaxingu]
MAVSAASTRRSPPALLQVYSDVSAEWVSGDNSLIANWSTTTDSIITHQVQLTTPVPFSEINDHTQYGSAFYSTPNTASATFQSGADVVVRAQFINSGALPNARDTNFRVVSNNWPVFALARDLGTVTAATEPVVFSVGHFRDPVIHSPAQPTSSRHSNAFARAQAFDTKVQNDANKISADYTGIVELSIRQAFGTIEFTISKNADGSFNANDIRPRKQLRYLTLCQSEISSNGNMNTVDVIFPAWPLFLYTNPAIGKYLLEASFRYQATGQYPNKFSIHDLGARCPNATGHNDGNDEHIPVEESGNMIIMSLSYAEKTGDHSHIQQYSALLDQWTQFLIEDSLIPANQISTDDFAGPLANQTNLAIKGIIGIRAMEEIENLLGNTAKAVNYSAFASDYVGQWQTLSASSSGQHLTLSYGNSSSWGLSYNLFADKMLKLNLFPESVYTMQTAWYKTVAQPFGVPLDTRHTYTKSDWEIWTAGIMTDSAGRDLFIGAVKRWASDGLSSQPFGDWYETTDGRPQGFRARPVVGGHLAYPLMPFFSRSSLVRSL